MKPSEVEKLLEEVVKHNIHMYTNNAVHRDYIVPMLWGPPGIGQTTIPRDIADRAGIPCETTIVAQYDPGELGGFPWADEENKQMIRYKPHFLPDGKPKNGKLTEPISLWLLDELPQAPVACMNIMSQVTNEWRLGEHYIAPGCTIICTGNEAKHRAGTNQMPSHLRDRLLHINVDVDNDDWIKWANQRGLDPSIVAYIRRNPAYLSDFDPDQRSCPSPRSWAKVNSLLQMDLGTHLRVSAIAGYLGDGHAMQFETYMRVADRMPDPNQIIADPVGSPVFGTGDEDILALLLAQVAALATKRNFKNIIKYVERLPNQEFSVFCIMDCRQRKPEITDTAAFLKWAEKDGAELLT
jgi:hypothetical protein